MSRSVLHYQHAWYITLTYRVPYLQTRVCGRTFSNVYASCKACFLPMGPVSASLRANLRTRYLNSTAYSYDLLVTQPFIP